MSSLQFADGIANLVRQSFGESLAIRAKLRYRRDFPLWETL
jgi:hypothetical protein